MAYPIFNSPIVRKIWEKCRLIWRRGRILFVSFFNSPPVRKIWEKCRRVQIIVELTYFFDIPRVSIEYTIYNWMLKISRDLFSSKEYIQN